MRIAWLVVLSLALMNLSAKGQLPSQERFPITARNVVGALSDKGINVAEEQISLVSEVISNEPHPALDILAVTHDPGNQGSVQSSTHLWIKIGCHVAGACFPFYAILHWPDQSVAGSLLSGMTNAKAASAALEGALSKRSEAVTMRAGARAVLMLENDRAHIQIVVISLENGLVGHRIRVASPDHKQVYLAEVVSANVLKGSF